MKKMEFFVSMISIVLLSGCASIMNERTQSIKVSSSTGVELKGTVDGVSFNAPGVVNVVRENKDKVIRVNTEGCDGETTVKKSVDPKFFANILGGIGGVFSASIDLTTERMWRYSEKVVISCSAPAVSIPAPVVAEPAPAAIVVPDPITEKDIQKTKFSLGRSSYAVEQMAKKSGCIASSGAGLLTEQGATEVYRVACDNGGVYLAKCKLRQCEQIKK